MLATPRLVLKSQYGVSKVSYELCKYSATLENIPMMSSTKQ